MTESATKSEFATKQDLLELELRIMKQIADLRAELMKELASVRTEIGGVRSETGMIRGDLLKEFGNFKTTLVMWNVGLIVALFAALKFIP